MHFHFNFSADDILWTLTFAALLVLLVVLLGRDRVKHFKWFTTSLMLMALSMLMGKLLFGRMAPIVSSEIFLVLADVTGIVAVLVVIEMARRAFAGASRAAWITATLIVLAVGGVVVAEWGPWPSIKTLFAGSTLSALRMMQLFAQKTSLLGDVLMIQLGLLIVLFGRRFKGGWRTHVQQIVIGLSTASMTQLAVRIIWQEIALHTTIHSQAEYQHVMDLQERFYNANRVVYLAAMVWWIVCLWIDEPGSKAADAAGEEPSIEAESPVEDGGAAG
jgi:hypothetical protein